jgi:hypothetical protein
VGVKPGETIGGVYLPITFWILARPGKVAASRKKHQSFDRNAKAPQRTVGPQPVEARKEVLYVDPLESGD